jgi:hypothetical protein
MALRKPDTFASQESGHHLKCVRHKDRLSSLHRAISVYNPAANSKVSIIPFRQGQTAAPAAVDVQATGLTRVGPGCG